MRYRSRQAFILVFWGFLLTLQAQTTDQPVLVFPQIAAGPSIRLEINLANLGNRTASGFIWFRQDDGESLELMVEGQRLTKINYSLAPGGARKFAASSDLLRVGYAVVMGGSASQVVGSLIYTIGDQYDVSVAHSPASTRAHLVVDRNKQFDSAVAFLNTGPEAATLNLSLRGEQGAELANGKLELPAGHKVARFIQDPTLLSGVPGQLTGILNITSDKPFHLLGLRQRLNGTLATLTAGTGVFSSGGSQIMYLVDSGVDPTSRGFSQEQLAGKTVYELTGISKAIKVQKITLRNTNLEKAVTLKCTFINSQGHEFLNFLIVLKCGETLVMDPFDFEIPATEGLRTSDIIFGTWAPPGSSNHWSAVNFGCGEFLFSAVAVAAPLDDSDTGYFLYPNEIAPIGECGVTPVNAGVRPGYSSQNLHVCNAIPMAFDYLTADRPDVAGEKNRVVQADSRWMALTEFTRTTSAAVGVVGTCQALAVPLDPAKVFEAFEALNEGPEESDEAEDAWPTALVIYNGAQTFQLRK